MAYNNTGSESGTVSWDDQQKNGRNRNDPNGAYHATGVEGGAVIADQFNQDVDRYRQIGHAETQRGPVQLDSGPAQQSRGLQMGALGLLRAQASGHAPSSAEILSQRANQQAGSAAAQRVAGARGAGASIAAFGGANQAATGQAMAANAANAAGRAGEVSRAQGAFTAGAGAMRGQDLGAATTNAQLDATNRELAERQQQHYERMAFDTRNSEMQAANEANQQYVTGEQQQRQARNAESAADYQKIKDVASGGLGGATSIFSDMRTKVPMGSLSHLMRGMR